MNPATEQSLHPKDYTALVSILRKISWAYILIVFSIHLAWLDILPDWLGYGLLISAIPDLAKYVPSASLLHTFACLLTVWNFIVWGMDLMGGYDFPQLITVIFGCISIYFHFQLLTNLADLSDSTGCSQGRRLRSLRTFNTLLQTMLAFPVPWETINKFTLVPAFILLCASGIMIETVLILNQLKKELQIH